MLILHITYNRGYPPWHLKHSVVLTISGAKNLMKYVSVCLKAKKHGFKIMPLLKENQ